MIDWKEFALQLLWHNVVHYKNEDSGYDIIISDSLENHREGEIGIFRYLSSIPPNCYKSLTWKELSQNLKVFKDRLSSDGHNCRICLDREDCKAFFKDDPDYEQCSGWKPESDTKINKRNDKL